MTQEIYYVVQDRIARLLWEETSTVDFPTDQRASWREEKWLVLADRCMKEVLAEIKD